jgi:hypothetical protein
VIKSNITKEKLEVGVSRLKQTAFAVQFAVQVLDLATQQAEVYQQKQEDASAADRTHLSRTTFKVKVHAPSQLSTASVHTSVISSCWLSMCSHALHQILCMYIPIVTLK